MALFEKYKAAWGNIEEMAKLYHDDAEMTMHSTGAKLTKADWVEFMTPLMPKLRLENVRCIYENDEIIVTHQFMTFPNGKKDAVMWVATKKDGLIHRIETGSTPLP